MPPIAPATSSKFSCRPHPHLYEINTWVWLEELSAQHGQRLTLTDVPPEEWDRLADLGFDLVYLLGVWHRSLLGRRIFRSDPQSFHNFDIALPGWRMRDVVGSPFSIQAYEPDPRIGTFDDLQTVHQQLRSRGMGLILDFVPNHTGFDHPWIMQHPGRYILGTEDDFRRDPNAFCLLDGKDGDALFIARGRDPYFAPWTDVAQLNYFSPDCRQAMKDTLKTISQYCDGVRCDMAMLVTNEIFHRTWGHFLGSWATPKTEFWQEITAALPDFIWLAEVYWDLEWKMQQLGFGYTYDKRLYDRLREGAAGPVRAHLQAEVEYQSKLARFLENHDEPRCAATFPQERMAAVVSLASTLPGMRFYHQGQFEGKKTFLPMPLARAQFEAPDSHTRELYERMLRFTDADVFHSGEWKLLEVQSAGDDTFQDLVAYRWQLGNENRLIVVNLGGRSAQGRVQQSAGGVSDTCLFCDVLTGREYLWNRADFSQDGLYVKLPPYQAHAFEVKAQ